MSHKLQLWRVMDSSDWTSLGHVPVCPAPATSAFHQVCAFWTLGECFGHSTMLSFDHANSFLLLSSIHALFGHEQLVYILKYPCLHQVLKGYFSVFSFKSFAAFAFIFIFRIHFWENCLYVMICVEVYFFSPHGYSVVPPSFIVFWPCISLACLLKIKWLYICGYICKISIIFHWAICLYIWKYYPVWLLKL